MNLQYLDNKINFKDFLIIISFSFIAFVIRWFFSFYFIEENLTVKLLFESVSDGNFYYPIIDFFSNFDFNNSLNPKIDDLKPLPIPVGSIIFHTIFYKFFGITGFYLIDFFGFFYFLLIFYLIFSLFNSKINSFCYSILLLSLPLIIDYFLIDKSIIVISQISDFFTLRVHRPFPSNLYFFTFIYLMLLINKESELKKMHIISLGVIFALTFSSFYYFFLIETISFFILILLKFKNNFFFQIKKNINNFLVLIVIFLIISSPFIYFIISHEPDVSTGAGVFDLTYDKRKFLFNHFISKFLDLKFLIINLICFLVVFFSNLRKINHIEIINTLFIIYIASILSPLVFIALSPKSGILYHFNNNIILCFLILFLFILITIFNNIKKIRFHYSLLLIVFFIFLFLYSSTQYPKYKDVDKFRLEFNKVVSLINQNQQDLSSLLTFNHYFMKWSVLNKKIKYLNLTMSGLTPKKSEFIENDLINVFTFLNLNSKDFINFFKNEKKGWRYLNENTQLFFYMKYTANSMNTYNNSKNFDADVLKFIQNSSPLYSQQIVIPNEEFERLENKFISHKINNFFKPDIIILEKRSNLFKKINIEKSDYCNLFIGDYFSVYININKINICEKNIN